MTVELSDLSDLPAANEEPRELGIRAELIGYRPAGSCAPEELPEAGLPAEEIVLLPPGSSCVEKTK